MSGNKILFIDDHYTSIKDSYEHLLEDGEYDLYYISSLGDIGRIVKSKPLPDITEFDLFVLDLYVPGGVEDFINAYLDGIDVKEYEKFGLNQDHGELLGLWARKNDKPFIYFSSLPQNQHGIADPDFISKQSFKTDPEQCIKRIVDKIRAN